MTRFVHLDYATTHPGVVRAVSAMQAVQHARQGFFSTRTLAKLLLSAVAAAVMVAAYEVMQSMAQGHLLVIWTGLWAAAFVALAVFASAARHAALRVKTGLDNWSRNIAQAHADQRLWAAAKTDARLMAELQAALLRAQANGPSARVGRLVSKEAKHHGDCLAPALPRYGAAVPHV